MEEIWKVIPGYEKYEVSNLGRVRRVGGRILSSNPRNGGYCVAKLYDGDMGQVLLIHRLVLLAFVGPPADGQVCCHLDGNPANNRLANLRWGSNQENRTDSIQHGTGWGLSLDQVRQVRQRLAAGESQSSIAGHFAVTGATISCIARGKTYRDVV